MDTMWCSKHEYNSKIIYYIRNEYSQRSYWIRYGGKKCGTEDNCIQKTIFFNDHHSRRVVFSRLIPDRHCIPLYELLRTFWTFSKLGEKYKVRRMVLNYCSGPIFFQFCKSKTIRYKQFWEIKIILSKILYFICKTNKNLWNDNIFTF